MNSYKIQEINDLKYKAIIFSTDHISPTEELSQIEEELRENKYVGNIIFDLLLINGNADNRFIEAFFDGIAFDRKSFKIANKLSYIINDMSTEFYYNNLCLVENSRLSNPIKFLIKKKKLPFNKFIN